MSKTSIRFVVVLVTFLVGVLIATGFLLHEKKLPKSVNTATVVQNEQAVRLEIPNASWEPVFFKALDERTTEINLPSLRTVLLPEPDLEVRIWYDGRPDIINGVIIRRRAARWSAVGIRQTNNRQPFAVKQEALAVPKSGWESVWKKLVSVGILTLPDGSGLKCHSGVLDGGGYVVETNVDKIYRTYRYDNPQFAECDEARRILLVDEIIADEFGLQRPQK
jgi:hypothetical protein